jgi:hypothetical protein
MLMLILVSGVVHSVRASGHASAAVAHGIAASGQVTSAALAVPLSAAGVVLGAAGSVSAAAARDLARTSSAPIGAPLEITDEAIITTPPNEALKASDKSPKP